MNERIRNLMIEAGKTIPGDKQIDADFCEKFAELIVKRCVEICRRQQYYDADDENKRGVNSGSYTCMNAIKRDFGVEE